MPTLKDVSLSSILYTLEDPILHKEWNVKTLSFHLPQVSLLFLASALAPQLPHLLRYLTPTQHSLKSSFFMVSFKIPLDVSKLSHLWCFSPTSSPSCSHFKFSQGLVSSARLSLCSARTCPSTWHLWASSSFGLPTPAPRTGSSLPLGTLLVSHVKTFLEKGQLSHQTPAPSHIHNPPSLDPCLSSSHIKLQH